MVAFVLRGAAVNAIGFVPGIAKGGGDMLGVVDANAERDRRQIIGIAAVMLDRVADDDLGVDQGGELIAVPVASDDADAGKSMLRSGAKIRTGDSQPPAIRSFVEGPRTRSSKHPPALDPEPLAIDTGRGRGHAQQLRLRLMFE
jgi:hypothetical protein